MADNVRYASREMVKQALDSAETARTNAEVDRALDDATDAVHGLCQRVFYPKVDTRYFDWPDFVQKPRSWRLWLNQNEIISLTSVTAGGVSIPLTNLDLYPNSGPPYNRIEINLGTSSTFAAAATYQQSVAIAALYGFRNDEAAAGSLATSVTSSQTTVDVTNSYAVGVGTLLRADSERMIVTEKTMITTGQTVQNSPTAQNSATTIQVTDGTAYTIGETILIDAERMLIVDIAANNLIVKRAWDGSVLAAHTAGATIYAPRRCTVDRGVLGTTPAAHSTVALVQHKPPPAIRTLAIAEALVILGQETAGYSHQLRPLQGGRTTVLSIDDQRNRVLDAYGRQARTRAV
jgi:hypothetical protein